jgi:hypothetical protein
MANCHGSTIVELRVSPFMSTNHLRQKHKVNRLGHAVHGAVLGHLPPQPHRLNRPPNIFLAMEINISFKLVLGYLIFT